MKNLLFLKSFNNYYNRKIKGFATLAEYFPYTGVIKQNINFSPADGIIAGLIVNWTDEWSPDYVVVFDDSNTIVSRWFILESIRTLNGQYKVNLRRDLMVDFYDNIREAPVYVMKANLLIDSPLLFNKEGMGYNQIKKGETLLKDETETPWIVFYNTKTIQAANKTITATLDTTGVPNISTLGLNLVDANDPTLGANLYYPETEIKMVLPVTLGGTSVLGFKAGYNYNDNTFQSKIWETITGSTYAIAGRAIDNPNVYIRDAWYNKLNAVKASLQLGLISHFDGIDKSLASYDEYLLVNSLNGKRVWSETTQKFYELRFNPYTSSVVNETISTSAWDTQLMAIFDNVRDAIVAEKPAGMVLSVQQNVFKMMYTLMNFSINFIEVPDDSQISIDMKISHAILQDAPYNMCAMPLTEENMALANALVQSYGTSVVYDLQIVPFCPVRRFVDVDGTAMKGINLTGGTADYDYMAIKQGTTTISYLLWATKSSDTFIIKSPIAVPTTAVELKVNNECDFYRLVSPNYNGSFDFSAAKNYGVDYFKVSFTYKPYSPYIQVSPNFKGLYGSDFNDARGLICNGDFSIAMTSDAWKNYETNNKNYQNIFNTEIKTMDYNHRQEMLSGAISLPIQAMGMGIGAGLMTGNAAIGAGAAVASFVGGAADMAIGQATYQRNKQSQIDMFNYNLGSIKARPDSLTKVSAYNVNNKYFPFIEYYTCTEEEKTMLRNKLKYDGMIVMTIGTISEYEDRVDEFNYFKGQLIQNSDISDDFHLIDAIAVELEKGVYL